MGGEKGAGGMTKTKRRKTHKIQAAKNKAITTAAYRNYSLLIETTHRL